MTRDRFVLLTGRRPFVVDAPLMFLNARIWGRKRSAMVALRVCTQTLFAQRIKPGDTADLFLMAKLDKGDTVRLVSKRGRRWIAAPRRVSASLVVRAL